MKRNIQLLLSTKRNKLTESILTVFFMIAVFFLLGIFILSGMGEDIWFDEVFSLHFMEKGYGEIAALTARDVHPPMYYWYLKTFHDLVKVFLPEASSVVIAKMASLLPFVGIGIYAFTGIRKRMGNLVMALFLFFICSMPQITNYTVEIRMYSLALFFVTAAFFHSYEIVLENKKIHWAAFCLYGILTAYTQYYACVAIAAIYVSLFVYFAVSRKKQQAVRVFICAGISVLAYLPWLPSFIGQLQAVNDNYWILPLTFRSIFGCFKFVFLPVSYAGAKNYILAVLMIAVLGICFLYAVYKEKDGRNRYLLICGMFIPVFTAFIGFVCSVLNSPIFVYRYLVPGLGAMWLAAACVLIRYRREVVFLLLLVPFLLSAHSNIQGFCIEEYKKTEQMESTEAFLDSFPEDAVILCNFNHVQAVTAYYLDNENILYGAQPEELITDLSPQCKGLLKTETLPELTSQKDVYFLGSFESREELLKEWEKEGIHYTEEGSFLLERYWFNVYHLK